MAIFLLLSCSVVVSLLLWDPRETTSSLVENQQFSMQKMHTRYVATYADNVTALNAL